jgi:protein-S-isoprenylcysteine O-methyltransferase Ste14
LLYGLLLGLLAVNPWFRGLLSISVEGTSALRVYWWLYLAYLGLALPIYLAFRPAALLESKNLLALGALRRIFQAAVSRVSQTPIPPLAFSEKEKYALVFLVVKLFFGPLMLNSAFDSWNRLTTCKKLFAGLPSMGLATRFDQGYIMLVYAVFLLDSFLFFIGYHTEAGFLRNKIRAVETSVLGILVCIVCYGPFNLVTVGVLGPSAADPFIVAMGNSHSVWTWALRAVAIFALLLLISASASLFTRASNLTNRGIVTWGPYRYIRHPGYLAKNLFWLMTLIPILIPNTSSVFFSWKGYWISCLCVIGGFLCWGALYFFRAITEEKFLSRDPDYIAYCQKVKWRFIPGVY